MIFLDAVFPWEYLFNRKRIRTFISFSFSSFLNISNPYDYDENASMTEIRKLIDYNQKYKICVVAAELVPVR